MKWQLGLVPAALVALVACKDTVAPSIVTDVVVTAGTRLLINEEAQLQVSPVDQRGNTMYGVDCSWSSSDPTVVAVAENGTVTGVSAGSARITATCDDVSGSAQVDVLGLMLEELPFPRSSNVGLSGSWGSSANDVFAVGGEGVDFGVGPWMLSGRGIILHHDGMRWDTMPAPAETESLVGVWGNSANDVFAVGRQGTILHYDGHTWSASPVPEGAGLFGGIWGSSSTDLFVVGTTDPFAVGLEGTIHHYDGHTWSASPVPEGAGAFGGIWGSSSTDVFAVGLSGTIVHYDGHVWTRMPAPVGEESLLAVWGSSGNNVFAVGEGGTVLHYDGVTWARVPVPTTNELTGVWGSSANDVYVIGTSGLYASPAYGSSVILHYDESGWRVVESDVPRTLSGLWGTAEDVLLVGSDMTVLRMKP